ncbi:SO_0444 family Cu/Zn efflux transporter [Desulfovibrio mangrovi]|uniref:SO_0444 family Cu/Zn efflux transporter n=1 Tax=Desulfovibrio mangrovi TaxID=2976983 RepID=UPI002247B37D|nr:SO_0444 family Cu/Zn efflux transporter [Desulfovibrio mangrovi]UZP66314.1 SO_0444 family Cu/Zn efflux transporter [Desulfovibrio mangrovi]
MDLITTYFAAVWDILLEASPYVLFGFFVAGLLKGFLPADFVARHLGKGKRAPVLKAALFGIPLPLCSCGVIPAAAGLRTQGASKGATTSFLISTPETGVDSMAVTYALLDPLMTVLRPLAAFISAITAGLLVDILPAERDTFRPQSATAPAAPERPQTTLHAFDRVQSITPEAHSGCGCGSNGCTDTPAGAPTAATEHSPSVMERFRKGMRFAFGELIADIGKWLIIGIFIAALITTFLPISFIENYVGDGLFGMMLMVIVGVPMYVCATASTPIAAALALKGLSPGAALVFLLAGPATNAATITVVSRMLGKRVAAVYVASIAVVSVLLGLAVNQVYGVLGFSVSNWVHATEEHGHSFIAVISALVLIGLVAKQMLQSYMSRGHGHGCSSHGCSCS